MEMKSSSQTFVSTSKGSSCTVSQSGIEFNAVPYKVIRQNKTAKLYHRNTDLLLELFLRTR